MLASKGIFRWVVLVVVAGCVSAGGEGEGVVAADPAGTAGEVLTGELTRAEIEEAFPDWALAAAEVEVDLDAALRLAELPGSAEVTVYFGSWCGDSRREMTRLWKAIDLGGGEAPFPVRYIAIDRTKSEPADLVGDREILYVPTFIVEHRGVEVGRIIEHAPSAIESDLLTLLEGTASGWISARDDLPTQEIDGLN